MAVLKKETICLLAFALLPSGCGGSLVDDSYRGQPIFQLTGRIHDVQLAKRSQDLKAAIFWTQTATSSTHPDGLREQQAEQVQVTFPAQFEVNIFTPPLQAWKPAESPFWLGFLLIYEDTDGSGNYSQPGELRGGADQTAIIYTQENIPAENSLTGAPLPKGFSKVLIPLGCGITFFPGPTDPSNCGMKLGASCRQDRDCGASAKCLKDAGYISFEDGYCVASVPEVPLCFPQDGVPVAIELAAIQAVNPNQEASFQPFWFKSCQSNTDCRQGYECATDVLACMPTTPVFVTIAEGFELPPLCHGL